MGRFNFRRCVLLLALTIPISAVNATPPKYEEFDKSILQRSKLDLGFISSSTTEAVRQVVGKKLRLKATGAPGSKTSTGGRISARNVIGLPANVFSTARSIQTEVTVLSTRLKKCKDPNAAADLPEARYEMVAYFFNVGGSTGVDDQTGNVAAQIRLRKRAALPLDASAWAWRCTNADCSTTEELPELVTDWDTNGPNTADSRIVSFIPRNTPVNLRITWDEALAQFRFRVKVKGLPAAVKTLGYGGVYTPIGSVQRSDPIDAFRLGPRVRTPNCDLSTGIATPFASIDVLIDNIRVSDTAEGN